MKLTLDLEQKGDGSWSAEIPELPGVVTYGDSADDATLAAKALAFRVLADLLDAGEISGIMVEDISFMG